MRTERYIGQIRAASPCRVWAIGESPTAGVSGCRVRFNRQLHQSEYDLARQHAKLVAQKLGISEQEAEGRIVAEIQRNSDQQTAEATGGKHDYEIRSIVGCQNLNCYGDKKDAQYAHHDYNREFIEPNQFSYDLGQQQLGQGQTYKELVASNYDKDPLGNTVARAAGSALVGTMAGGIGAAWGLGTAFTYTGDAISYQFGLSKEQPDYKNAAIVGGVAGALSPLNLPLNTLGNSTAGKVVVGGYNSLVAGTGAFAGTAITNSNSSPVLSGGIGLTGAALGQGINATMPGPVGMSINQLIQALSGPAQTAIEMKENKEKK